MNKVMKISVFAVFSLIMGAVAGAIVWTVLRVMSIGIDFLWYYLPVMTGLRDNILYNMIVCIAGGIIIGLWQKKYGILPDDMHQVMGKIKACGAYPYDRLHIIAVAALLPLIFGGALGPEAGLSGLIAGLCCFIGDKLKYKGDEVAALAEAGFAATLGVIFNSPLFGIIDNLEPDSKEEKYREKLVSKKSRIFIYIMGVAGGMLAMKGLGILFGGSTGLPRFDAYHGYGLHQWKWVILLIAAGVIFGLFYIVTDKMTFVIADKIKEYRVTSCVIAGVFVAIIGYYLPLTMFSGEHEMGQMMTDWQNYPVNILILIAIGKLLLVNICINFGWRGGSIFPIIFAGLNVGYAMAAITGMDGSFAVAVTVAALYAYIMRKPVTVAAVLLLCFPITYILPILVAAFIASKIPVPKRLSNEH